MYFVCLTNFVVVTRREDLVQKTMRDISSFSREKAEKEVDKFLLDAEMANLYIQFMKKKEEDPDFEVPAAEEEGFFSFRTLIYGYLGFVAFTTIPAVFRNWVAAQEVAGTWHGTNIQAIDNWIQNTAPTKIPAAAAAIQTVSDAVSSGGLQ